MMMIITSITQEALTTIPTQTLLPTQRPTALNSVMTTARGTRNVLPKYRLPTISNTRYTNGLTTTLSDNFPISLMLDNVIISQNTLKLLEKIRKYEYK